MLERLYDHTPDELELVLSTFASNLMAGGVVTDEDEAIKAAFCLVALDLSNDPLTEDELEEACKGIQLYMYEGEEN